jgi:uncharacterized membrane protein
MYEFLLFVHVLAAVVWVGGGLALNFVGTRIATGGNPVEMAGFMHQGEWIGTRVFAPASVILLIAGVIMTLDAWSFDTLWIGIGIAGFLYSFINSAFLVGPLSGRTGKLMSERGAEDPTVVSNIRRLFVLSRIELLVMVVVVWAMTVKPTL